MEKLWVVVCQDPLFFPPYFSVVSVVMVVKTWEKMPRFQSNRVSARLGARLLWSLSAAEAIR